MLNRIATKIIDKADSYFRVGKVYNGVRDPLSERVLMDNLSGVDISESAADLINSSSKDNFLEILKANMAGGDLTSDKQKLLSEFTYEHQSSFSEIVHSLKTYGIVIFPSLYTGERLRKIKEEFDRVIKSGSSFSYQVTSQTDSKANSFGLDFKRDKLKYNAFPELAALFGSEILLKISEVYFSGQKFDFNEDLFAQWTEHTNAPLSGELHWDKQLTLKSWLYVSEATDGYGAMRVEPGAARWTRQLREENIFRGIPYHSIKNTLEENENAVVSSGGPAGTFFIFVTDTPHGASSVDHGKRREIIRSQSRPTRIKDWASWATSFKS